MTGWMLLTLAVGLVALAGVFAATDAALSVISRARVSEMERAGVRGARRLGQVVADMPRHLNLLILLRLCCELGATTMVALVAVSRWGVSWPAALLTAGVMTLVSFVLLGVGPRTLGQQHAYRLGLIMAGPVRWLGRVLNPLTRLLIVLGNMVTPGRGYREGPFATQVELREAVDIAEQRGVVEHGEREMIHSVFSLSDTIAREVMVPRTEVVWIERTKAVRQALALALRSGFSRIPVVGESIDDVVGVVYLKDLVRWTNGGQPASARVSAVMREPEFVPESKPVDDLLREMQARRIHIATVIDEYGGTAGLVTIEDILEEIVGEITDEYDVERPPVERLPDGQVRVTARLPVEDLAEMFGRDLPTDDVETVGGLLAHALGLVPIPGATAVVDGLELVAESAGGRRNRVDSVLVRPVELADGDTSGVGASDLGTSGRGLSGLGASDRGASSRGTSVGVSAGEAVPDGTVRDDVRAETGSADAGRSDGARSDGAWSDGARSDAGRSDGSGVGAGERGDAGGQQRDHGKSAVREGA